MTSARRGSNGAVLALAMALACGCAGAGAAPVTVDDFSDLLFWAGSGSNEAALVLQFPTVAGGTTYEPASVAWGYRWDGSASFEAMLFALTGRIVGGPAPGPGADPRLAVDVSFFGAEWGYFVNELAFDQTGLGSGWTPGIRHIGPYDPDTGEYPAQYQLDAAGGVWTGAPFELSSSGISTTPLVSGGWYAFVQADGSEQSLTLSRPVAAVNAVPEPSALALALAGGSLAWTVVRWRRRTRG